MHTGRSGKRAPSKGPGTPSKGPGGLTQRARSDRTRVRTGPAAGTAVHKPLTRAPTRMPRARGVRSVRKLMDGADEGIVRQDPAPARREERPSAPRRRGTRPAARTSRPVILVGIDFSPATDAAIAAAVRTAQEHGGRIVLVHALAPLGAPGLDLAHPAADPIDNETADLAASSPGRTPLERLQAFVAAQGVPVEAVTRPGHAVHVLATEASRLGARVVVVGTHGRGRLSRDVFGSVAEGLLQACRSPVIIVPGDGGPEYHAPKL